MPRYGLVHLLDLPEERLEIIELVVSDDAPAAGQAISDMGLPDGALVISVLRGGSGFVPKADTVVEAGDEVLVVLDPGIEDDITANFVERERTRLAVLLRLRLRSRTIRDKDDLAAAGALTPRSACEQGHPSALGPVGNGGASGRPSVPPRGGRPFRRPPGSSNYAEWRSNAMLLWSSTGRWRGSGGSPEQEPAAVGTALDLTAGDQLTERGGDGRPTRADHAGERAVRKAQRDDDAVGRHAPPALRQAPQQCKQPVIHAREVGDRLHDDEPLRTARGTLDERGEDLRPLRGTNRERLIDHRQANGAERTPFHGAREQDLRVPVLPGAHEVTRAEQFGAGMVAHDRFSHEQPVEDEQADRVRPARKSASRGPRAARNVDRASEEALTDLAYAARIEPARELWICFEKLYGAVTGVWHYERNPRRSKGAGIPTGPTCNVALRIPVWKDNGRGSPGPGSYTAAPTRCRVV